MVEVVAGVRCHGFLGQLAMGGVLPLGFSIAVLYYLGNFRTSFPMYSFDFATINSTGSFSLALVFSWICVHASIDRVEVPCR
jgi:hypothetical protein